jgi:GNAT superfamily N-acetyltransferase
LHKGLRRRVSQPEAGRPALCGDWVRRHGRAVLWRASPARSCLLAGARYTVGVDGEVQIRTAVEADAEALAALSGELGYPSTPEQVLSRLCLLRDPERTLLVAQSGGLVAGFIDVHVQRVVESEPYAEVGGLVVGAAQRGTGVGAALLVAAAAWSRARGLERLWIRANLARVGPHDFYKAVGCRTVKDQRVYEYPL